MHHDHNVRSVRCPDCYGSGIDVSPMGERVPCRRCDSFGTVPVGLSPVGGLCRA
jgi:hypothetical protein